MCIDINNIMNDRTVAVEILTRIAKMLNAEIETSGEIQINNKTIWEGYLHKMDNAVWTACLEALVELNQQHPEMLTMSDYASVETALKTVRKHQDYYDRVLDMRNKHLDHKKLAWRAFMTIREVVNRCWDLDLPNSDTSKITSKYTSLYE